MSLENTSGRSVLANYGTRNTETQYGGDLAGENGKLHTVEYVFDYDELPAYNATSLAKVIPAGARITEAAFDVITAFVSASTLTDLDVGLWQDDNGATYDADGLLTAAQLTQTVIGTLVRTLGTGAVVNGVPLTEACQVYITPTTDDLTAGRARLTVSYYEQPGAQGSQNQDGT